MKFWGKLSLAILLNLGFSLFFIFYVVPTQHWWMMSFTLVPVVATAYFFEIKGGILSSVYIILSILAIFRWLHPASIGKMQADSSYFTYISVLFLSGLLVGVLQRLNHSMKEKNKQLKELIGKLEEGNVRLRQFVYSVSHDFRQPVRIIVSFVSLIKDRLGKDHVLNGEVAEFMDYISDNSRYLSRMIDDLLKYSRLDSPNVHFSDVDLNVVVEQVLKNLSMIITEAQAEVKIVDKLPTVFGEETQLLILFQNIIENGIKYRKPLMPPVVEIKCQKGGGDHLISITDNGIGFDKQYKQKIFELFQRLSNNQEYTGTGIGLAICKKVVELHKGQIWAESEPGVGSTFYLSLPVYSPELPVNNHREIKSSS